VKVLTEGLAHSPRNIDGSSESRLMRKLGASRREFFDAIDRPALLPLPAARAAGLDAKAGFPMHQRWMGRVRPPRQISCSD